MNYYRWNDGRGCRNDGWDCRHDGRCDGRCDERHRHDWDRGPRHDHDDGRKRDWDYDWRNWRQDENLNDDTKNVRQR